MRKFTLFFSLLLATVMTTFAQDFADGVYELKNADVNGSRGYFVYSTEYADTPQLSGVQLGSFGANHYTYGDSKTNSYWYLYTVQSTGKRYLFNIAEGHLLSKGSSLLHTEDNGSTVYNVVLSKEVASPVEIEESTRRSGYYAIKIAETHYLMSSCGWPQNSYPVRVGGSQADDGTPVELLPVTDVTVDDAVMAAVKAVIDPDAAAPGYTATATVNDATMGTATAEVVDGEATFTATANEGYVFVKWTNADAEVSTENPYKVTLEANLELTAVFEPVTPPAETFMEIKNVTPADGSTVAELHYILLDLGVWCMQNVQGVDVTDADGNKVGYAEFTWKKEDGTTCTDGELVLKLQEAITTTGTFTIVLPKNSIWDYEIGIAETTLTFTVDPTTGIEGVDAEVEQVIYDITGRRIDEITSAGVYIVNGVKVLVK